jgi:hypothetical protein
MFPFTIAHPYAPRPSRARIASYDADSVAVEVLADDFHLATDDGRVEHRTRRPRFAERVQPDVVVDSSTVHADGCLCLYSFRRRRRWNKSTAGREVLV